MFKIPYAVVTSLTSVATIFLAVFVFSKGRTKRLNIIYALWALSVGLWSFFLVLNIFARSQEEGILWVRWLHFWAIIIPAVYVHFVLLYLNKYETRKKLVIFLYAIAGIFLILDFTPWLLSAEYREKFDFFVCKPRALYALHLSVFLGSISYVYYELVKSYFETRAGKEKRGVKYFFIATISAYSGGITNYLINYDFLIYPLYPYGNFGVLVYVALIGIMIVRFRFLDIEVIIKKTLVFAGLAAFIFGVFAFVTFVTTEILNRYLPVGNVFSTLMSVLLIVGCYEPLRRLLINLTDRFLFQKKFDFAKVLKEASREIALTTSFSELTEKLIDCLSTKARTSSAAIYVRSRDGAAYDLTGEDGFQDARPLFRLPSDSALVHWLAEHQSPLMRTALAEELSRVPEGARRENLRAALSLMENIKAEVAIPSFLSSSTLVTNGKHPFLTLQGLFFLGGKKSDEDYTEEDLTMLQTLAQEHAIAHEKLRVFGMMMQEREEKVEAQKQAELVNYTRTLKHESGNKLVGIDSGTANLSAFVTDKFSKLKDRLKDRLTHTEIALLDSMTAYMNNALTGMQRSCENVQMIINTVVGSLGRDDSKQMIYFRVPWETAKRNAKIDYLFHFDAPLDERFRIYGNPHQVEQVFENLFTNSKDAVGDRAEKMIYLRGEHRDHQGRKVAWFEYWDSGSGVPEELFEKVFEQGFSTKPKPKDEVSPESGHGHGLYVCRKIIEEGHGGKIWLEPNESTGKSKFVFWIPSHEKEMTEVPTSG